jgi:hypothetical protein
VLSPVALPQFREFVLQLCAKIVPSGATLIPPAFGLAGVNLHTWTGWVSVRTGMPVANLEMHGKGRFWGQGGDGQLDRRKRNVTSPPRAFGSGLKAAQQEIPPICKHLTEPFCRAFRCSPGAGASIHRYCPVGQCWRIRMLCAAAWN